MLDAAGRPMMDAVKIAENAMHDAAARMSYFSGDTMQPGGDGQVIQHVPHPAPRFVLRPMLAAADQLLLAHSRTISDVTMQEDVFALAENVGVYVEVRPGGAVAFQGR